MCVDSFPDLLASIPIWYILLLLGSAIAMVLFRSLFMAIGLIVLCIFGSIYAGDMEGVSEVVSFGLSAGLITLAAFAVFQIIFSVRRL